MKQNEAFELFSKGVDGRNSNAYVHIVNSLRNYLHQSPKLADAVSTKTLLHVLTQLSERWDNEIAKYVEGE